MLRLFLCVFRTVRSFGDFYFRASIVLLRIPFGTLSGSTKEGKPCKVHLGFWLLDPFPCAGHCVRDSDALCSGLFRIVFETLIHCRRLVLKLRQQKQASHKQSWQRSCDREIPLILPDAVAQRTSLAAVCLPPSRQPSQLRRELGPIHALVSQSRSRRRSRTLCSIAAVLGHHARA